MKNRKNNISSSQIGDLEDNINQSSNSALTNNMKVAGSQGTHAKASEVKQLVKRILLHERKQEARVNLGFLIAAMFALVVDPFFLYIPIIDEGHKCVEMNKKSRTGALLLRSLGDLIIALHIIYQIRQTMKAVQAQARGKSSCDWKCSGLVEHAGLIFGKLPKSSIFADFLALLPIPQVVVLVFFFEMKSSLYWNKGFIPNLLLVAQYLPRIYRTKLLTTKVAKTTGLILFYLFLYVCGSHVIGGFWYFFSILREMSCWYQVYEKHSTSKTTFHCGDNSSRNITLLDQFCPINKPDASVFDFGIFLESLQSNNRGSIKFINKLFFSIWWGMRNISSFGQSLATSNFFWENCFAICISVLLPLLFYIIGNNVQTLIQNRKREFEIRRNKNELNFNLKLLISRYKLPPDMQKQIIADMTRKLEEDKNADVENLFLVLPWHTKRSLKRFLCMSTLSKVPRLAGMDEKVLKMICDYLKAVIYQENSYIIRSGEPLDFILLVTEGMILTYTINCDASSSSFSSSITRCLKKGDFYGDEQLLSWASLPQNHFSFTALPISKENMKCHTKVECFVLKAKDLETVVQKCRHLWRYNNVDELEMVARSTLEAAVSRIHGSRWRMAVRSQQSLISPPAIPPNHAAAGGGEYAPTITDH